MLKTPKNLLKSLYIASISALIMSGLSSGLAHANSDPFSSEIHNVILVHGLYADGSSWGKIIPILQANGLHVTAVQNPTTSLEDDVKAVKRVMAQQTDPYVLVGHSYGGMVISEAGNEPEVKGLVYIAARAPDAGEDYMALTKKFPKAPASAGLKWDENGYGALDEASFIHDFAGDLPESEAKAYYAVQQPAGKAILNAKTTVADWRNKPTWYAVSTEDRTINPDLERFMAKRMNAKTVELKASHVSLLSQPDAVANLIMEAAHVTGH